MKMWYFREYREMPFVKRGMRVEHTHNGKKGRIAGPNPSGNLNIIFDGENYSTNCHPRWKMKYFDNNGNLIAEFNE